MTQKSLLLKTDDFKIKNNDNNSNLYKPMPKFNNNSFLEDSLGTFDLSISNNSVFK